MQVKGNAHGIKPHKMRCHDNKRPVGFVRHPLKPFKGDELTDRLRRPVPEHPVVKRCARQMHIIGFGNGAKLPFRLIRKADPEIGHRHVTPFGNTDPKHGRHDARQDLSDPERHMSKAFDGTDPEPGRQIGDRQNEDSAKVA